MEKEKLLKRVMIELLPLALGQNMHWDKEIRGVMEQYFEIEKQQPTPTEKEFMKAAEEEAIGKYVADFSPDQQHHAFTKGAKWAFNYLKK